MSLTPHQKNELDRYITGNYGEDQFRYDEDENDYCRICDSPLEYEGTEEEERAAASGLCIACYEEKGHDN